MMSSPNKRVLCISWDPALALTRELLLRHAGYEVVSALGPAAREHVTRERADLLVLGHSVPREQKRSLIQSFRQHCNAPVLSLVASNQTPVPEATVAIPADDPDNFVRTVREILN